MRTKKVQKDKKMIKIQLTNPDYRITINSLIRETVEKEE